MDIGQAFAADDALQGGQLRPATDEEKGDLRFVAAPERQFNDGVEIVHPPEIPGVERDKLVLETPLAAELADRVGGSRLQTGWSPVRNDPYLVPGNARPDDDAGHVLAQGHAGVGPPPREIAPGAKHGEPALAADFHGYFRIDVLHPVQAADTPAGQQRRHDHAQEGRVGHQNNRVRPPDPPEEMPTNSAEKVGEINQPAGQAPAALAAGYRLDRRNDFTFFTQTRVSRRLSLIASHRVLAMDTRSS